jgi:cytochrome oxidase assembly protein ShyY1
VYAEPTARRWSFPKEGGYQRTWGDIEAAEMAAEVGVPARPWILVDGDPVMGDDDVADRTPPISGWRAHLDAPPHFDYAVTWYSLATVVTVMWLSVSFRREASAGEPPVAGGSRSG